MLLAGVFFAFTFRKVHTSDILQQFVVNRLCIHVHACIISVNKYSEIKKARATYVNRYARQAEIVKYGGRYALCLTLPHRAFKRHSCPPYGCYFVHSSTCLQDFKEKYSIVIKLEENNLV